MSEAVSLIIMLTILYTVFAVENHDLELVKLVKRQNEDITLKCILLEAHEEFNRNINVSWYYLRTCKYCAMSSNSRREWKPIDCNGTCKVSLTLDNTNAFEGFYKCRIFPYHVDSKTTLQIEITKTFQLELAENAKTGLPEILETPNEFTIPHSKQPVVLQCKTRSTKQKPTIKWFKQKTPKHDENDDDTSMTYFESPRAIKYFENFYEPIASSGLKELMDHVYLSKLIINNITDDSIYICVAINYYGFVYRDFSILIEKNLDVNDEDYESDENYEEVSHSVDSQKSFGLFLIPLLLFIIIFIQISAIIYLMIYRSIMKETNKNFV